MSVTKPKFLRARLEKRLRNAEQLASHPRKGVKWQRLADDLRRRIAKLPTPEAHDHGSF